MQGPTRPLFFFGEGAEEKLKEPGEVKVIKPCSTPT